MVSLWQRPFRMTLAASLWGGVGGVPLVRQHHSGVTLAVSFWDDFGSVTLGCLWWHPFRMTLAASLWGGIDSVTSGVTSAHPWQLCHLHCSSSSVPLLPMKLFLLSERLSEFGREFS